MLHIGCHLSSSKGFAAMGRQALELGADTFQFFTRNPRGSKAKDLDHADAAALVELMREHQFAPIIAHAPYTLNLCGAEEANRTFARETMADDLRRLEFVPGQYYNFHPGSHVGQGTEAGIAYIAEGLNAILRADQSTTVLLETMAGKGSEVGGRFEELREILDRVELPEECLAAKPSELSGGQRQRVMIASAIIGRPKLLIADEPTTALDVTIQAKILELIRRIQKERGISVIYITHDLGVVAKVADYVDVMYAGKIVETGTIDEIFYDPKHPYTWGLLSAMPDLDTADDRLYTIPGSPPNLLHEKQGDAFAPRNHFALNIDDEVDPPMFKISDTHYAATWLLDPRAPKVDMPPELAQRIARMRAEAEKIKEAE